MKRATLLRLRAMIEKASVSLPDEDALEAVQLFPGWKAVPPMDYQSGDRVRYGEKLYKCVQPHTSQDGWPPDITPALWTEVAEPGEIPVWKQPTGVQDAYMMGDLVHYPTKDDPVWVSDVDYNTWEPGIYGWTEAGLPGGAA